MGGVFVRAALGLIEAVGLTTAITALDAAGKAADVKLVGYEKVIGAGKAVSVTIHIAGEVAAVKASVEAGVAAACKVGTVLSHHVIPRPHEEVDLIIKAFEKNLQKKVVGEQLKESEGVEENNNQDKKKEE